MSGPFAPFAAAFGNVRMDGMDMNHSSMNMPSSSSNTGSSNGAMSMMMPNYLFSRDTGFYVLFKKAFVSTTGGFVGALFASFAFAALTSVVFFLSQRLEREAGTERSRKAATPRLLLSAGAHAFRWFMHYVCMLLVMTMNIWIILAVVLGHFAGFVSATFIHRAMKSRAPVSKSDPDGERACDGDCC